MEAGSRSRPEDVLDAIVGRAAITTNDPQYERRTQWANECRRTAVFVETVTTFVDQVGQPAPGSQLEREIAQLPAVDSAGMTIRPAQTSLVPAVMGLHAAEGYLRAMADVAATVATVLPLEVIARSAIECCGLVVWLCDPAISGKARVARTFLLRISAAEQALRAAKAVGVDPPSPTVADLQAAAKRWGWQTHRQKVGNRKWWTIDGEELPGATIRAEGLLRTIDAKGAYHIYSGTVHAELHGLWRAFSSPMNAAGETYNVINLDFEAAWEAVLVANLAAAKAAEAYRQLTRDDFPEAQSFLGDCRTRLIGLRPVSQ
jgi:hypothetical protein